MTTRPGYIWNGTEWVAFGPEVAAPAAAYQNSAPVSPSIGDLWIDADFDIPSIDVSQFLRWRKTAVGGETTLSGLDDTALTLSYTPNYEQVYINGVLQVRGQDYIATNGTSITGLTALAANDVVEILGTVARQVADVYTQAQTNSLLDAKSNVSSTGLVLITSVTIGSAVSSVVVNNCFSSSYENYFVTISGGTASQEGVYRIQYNNSTGSTYKRNGYYQTYASTTLSGDVGTGGTSTYFGMYNTVAGNSNSVIFQPFATKPTTHTSQWVQDTAGGIWNGIDTNAVSNTGFTITPSAGTITGGTIKVYGYK